MRNNHCKKCGKQIKYKNKRWTCVNLICIDYNKQVRRNRANRQKRQKNEIQSQEEE